MYLLYYILPVSGKKIYDKVKENLRESDLIFFHDYQYYIKEEFNPELKIFNESLTLYLDSNFSTILSLNVKYTHFLINKEYEGRVKKFELQLANILSGLDFFYRVDESIVEKYWTQVLNPMDEFWYKKNDAFKKFSLWVERQEKIHWSKINLNPNHC